MKNFKLYTDASESGLRAILTKVKDDGKEQPIAYVSQDFVQIRAKL